MISRDLALISISAAIGALASLFAARLLSFSSSPDNPKRPPSPPRLPSPPSPNANGSACGVPPRSPFDPAKREGYISWDDYFMAIAFLSAQRSKDPSRQVGACLVSQDDIILGIGYNGFPRGCSDDKLPWAKKSINGDPLETKYPYVVHAEVNAILNTNHASAAGQKLYVTMFPCNECAKIIIQSGVSEVIYYVDKRIGNSDAAYIASHKLLSMAGVKVRKHQPQMTQILVKFQEP
ncbi:uncharacterized protein LOC103971094 [Musa acuminata AAA Group]|uniref:dCMP deaminase n=1 Tax=Musa acuminata subsp. malaccensis TaxID=214687 RepID=A0A804JBF1_MUSAM|nr:PREDICTED: deoxycytidylate deaminase [Musa acuminata subsp. malaccensis]